MATFRTIRVLMSATARVNACDVPEKYDDLAKEFSQHVCSGVEFRIFIAYTEWRPLQKNISIFKNGHLVSRTSDWIVYNVPAEYIEDAVREYGHCESRKCAPLWCGMLMLGLQRPRWELSLAVRLHAKLPRSQPSTNTWVTCRMWTYSRVTLFMDLVLIQRASH